MHTDLYDASVPVFLRYLDRLAGLVTAADAHVVSHGLDASSLLGARLAPDMLALDMQVQIAANFSLRACFPLAGLAIPPYGEFPATFDGLQSRIAHAAALLKSLNRHQFSGRESQVLESQAGNTLVVLKASEFLLQYALPNFFFHLSTAYALLRSHGVAIGKEDFDGFHSYRAAT